MNIAIICAMSEELHSVQQQIKMPLIAQVEKANNRYYKYSDEKNTVVAVISGIGKVNAAVTTQILLDNFDIDYVLNVGVAGSISKVLSFGDVVVAKDLVQHDFDITAFGYKLGQIARLDTFSFQTDQWLSDLLLEGLTSEKGLKNQNISYGRIVSGDQFINDAEKADFLYQEFNAIACEMEGAAVAHVCYLNKKPFAVVRALSDMAGQASDDASSSFERLKIMAADCAALAIKQLLERI